MEYASKSVGTAGLTTGIIGSALGVLGGGLNLLGSMPRTTQSTCSEDHYVTRYEASMQHTIAEKDSEIALIKSEQNTENKIADVYERIMTRVNADKNEQQAINMQQAVYNGTNNATINCLSNQVSQLMSLTQLKIPNTSVCPGWGNVTITPATTTTTVAG